MTASTASEAVMADTNLLVYAHDVRDPQKHTRAVQVLEELIRSRRLILSIQVLNEFYAVITRRNRPSRLDHSEASQIIRDLCAICPIIPIDTAVTLTALDAMPRHGLSFWDALIWAAAKLRGVSEIYTEDFQPGREIEGVRFVNPLVP